MAFLFLASAGSILIGQTSRMLVGALVGGREVGTLEVLKVHDGYLLPLRNMSAILRCELVPAVDGFQLLTPLGEMPIEPRDLTLVDGVRYLHSDFVEQRLAIPVRFDSRRYALDLDPPWEIHGGGRTAPELVEQRPDILAPRTTLSGISGRLTHTTLGQSSTLSGSAHLEGRTLDGVWKVRWEDTDQRPFQVREYEWATRIDRTSYLLGRQNMQLHPSLAGFDMAGFQVAWSNRYPDDHSSLFESDGLYSSTARPVETIRGQAPPGSFVQLRVENRIIDTRQVGYSGLYEFYEVPLPARRLTEIEVLIFDRHNRHLPVETRRFRLASSNLLLPAGTVIHTGGFGATGTFTERFFDSPPEAESSSGGYYQWRQGLNSLLTSEAAVQYAGSSFQTQAGLVARLSDTWVAAFGASYTPGATGHSLSLEGFLPEWRFYVSSSSTPAEFDLVGPGSGYRDHVVEVFHQPRSNLTVGLTSRLRDDDTRESRYVLPSVTWRPIAQLYFDVRPDVYGDYLGNAAWSIRHDTRLRLFTSRLTDVELSHDLDDRYQISLDSSFGADLPARYTLSARRRSLTFRGWSVRGGVVCTDGQAGYLAGVSTPIYPGFQIQAEYQSIPYRSFVGDEEIGRLMVSISTDLGRAGGGFVPSRRVRRHRARGSIGGRIVLTEEFGDRKDRLEANDLSGVAVLVDDRVRARTGPGGRFFVDNIEPGYHVVRLDPERLPIHLNLARSEYVVEVAAGSASRVTFSVQPEYGLAGRVVSGAGRSLPGVSVELIDAWHARRGKAVTDRFGLYRMDGIAPGRYRLRVVREIGDYVELLAERTVEIVDDFLFEQDLELPQTGELDPSADRSD